MTIHTVRPARHAQFGLIAMRRLLQRNIERGAQIRAALRPCRARAPAAFRAAKDNAKDSAERFREAAKALRARTAHARHIRIDAGVTVLIVCGAFLRIGEHSIRVLTSLKRASASLLSGLRSG